MNIPFLDLKAQYETIRDEIETKLLEVTASQRFILGPEVEALENEIAAYCGCRFGVGVSSGSDALLASLMALGIGEGDYVITTPFTFFATAGAIARLKASPIFCDIEPEGFNIDAQKIKTLLQTKIDEEKSSRIRAIIPVHLFGQMADMDAICDLAESYGLQVVEDAAQAIGAEYPGRGGSKRAGTFGNIGIFSFFPSKNLGGFGDGGMIVTDSEEMAARLRLLRAHGSKNKYFYEFLGGNFRLDALQAAILRVKLGHLEKWGKSRREKADRYHELFRNSGLIDGGFVQIPVELYRDRNVGNFHIYHQYVTRARNRDELQAYMKEKGVPSAVYYPLGLHQQKCFAYLGYKPGDFPETEKATAEVLALPIYPEISPDQQERVVSTIRDYYSSTG